MSGFAWVFWVGWTLVGLGAASLLAWLAGSSARGQRRCPTCDYDLSATDGLTCPECGKTARSERSLHRRRRRRARRRIGLALVLLGAAVLVFNPNRRDGWASSVPAWAIWPMMPWFDSYADAWIAGFESGRVRFWPGGGTLNPPARWERLLVLRRFVRELEANPDPASATPFSRRGVTPGDHRYAARDVVAIAERAKPEHRAALLLCLKHLRIAEDRRTIERLRRMLASDREDVWLAAFEVIPADRRELIPELLAGLDHPSAEVRAEAARCFYDLVPLDPGVAQKLAAVKSTDPDHRVRGRAGAALWRHGETMK